RAGRLKDDPLGCQGSKPGDKLFDARGCVVEALGKTAGSRMGVEKIPADIDADQNSVHEKDLLESQERARGPTAFLFQLVNAGFAPSDYSNRGAPISERTQLTVGPENPRGRRSRSEMVLVLHNPGFNGYRVDDGNIPAVGRTTYCVRGSPATPPPWWWKGDHSSVLSRRSGFESWPGQCRKSQQEPTE